MKMEFKTLADELAALKLFNEKVEKLLNLSFVKEATSPNARVSFIGERQSDGSFKIFSSINGPASEAVDAFVLTFRFFIQDNERISLCNISTLYKSSNIDSQQKAYFESARDNVNKMLDSPNFMNLSYNNIAPTNREVMNVIVYGWLAHTNLQENQRYKEWMGFHTAAPILQACFDIILMYVLRTLEYISQVNTTTIQQLTNHDEQPII
jgi:hypothetical protein